jgi:hypothetical protein
MTNGSAKKIAIGVAIAVFTALIIGGVRSCRWMRDTLIRLEDRARK